MNLSCKCSILGSIAALCTVAFGGQRADDNGPYEASLGVGWLLQSSADGNGLHRTGRTAANGLLSVRYRASDRYALEVNYGHAHITQTVSDATSDTMSANLHEVTLGGLMNFPSEDGKFTPFLELGGGLLQYSPTTAAIGAVAPQSQNKPALLYSVGFSYALNGDWSLRAAYRGLYSAAPSYGVERFRTNTYLHIAEPTVSLAYHF